jgi:pimeloyl-ACP methyl ester carboxylesterase
MVTVQERSLNVWQGRVEARVKIAGSGPPLVFLHAATGLHWDPFLDNLAGDFTVYAPEHPGTSPGDPDAIRHLDDLWDLVIYYYEVFDQLGLSAPAVVGASFGGMVAAELAATNPERISKLVLISPIGLWRDDEPVQNWMVGPQVTDLGKLLFYDPTGPVATAALTLPEDPEARIAAQIQIAWALACTGRFVWPIPDKGLKKRIHRISAPTLVVWGNQDRLVPAVYAEEFRKGIPQARVEMVDSAGHVPQLEQLQRVSGLVLDFLKQ